MQPYIQFQEATAIPISLTQIRISWELCLTASNLSAYKFRVLRSEQGLNGPYDVVQAGISTSTKTIIDTQVKLASRIKEFTWWVEIYDPATGATFSKRSKPIEISHTYDKTALAIIEKAHLLLYNEKKGIGIDCVLHNLKSWGTRCPICWDPVKMKIKLSNCQACYGSGFQDGYFNPVPIKIAIDQGQFSVHLADVTAVETARHNAWTVPSPIINTNDVITDITTNYRYRVINQGLSVKRGAALRQFMVLSMLSKSSVEYNLPIS